MRETHLIEINHASRVGEARRLARYLAGTLDFTEIEKSNSEIIVTEAATNILKHAYTGKIILMTTRLNSMMKLEIIAIDKGPGISDVAASMTDGISTTDTLGIGLGVFSRLATNYDLYSCPDRGTVIWSEIISKTQEALPVSAFPYKMGAISTPIKNEEYCGDGWSIQPLYSDVWRILISDGLGHGFGAYQATSKAIEIFESCQKLSLNDTLMSIHHGLKKTRGAAISLIEINFSAAKLDYVGIGNISGKILGQEKSLSLVSIPGIVGHLCQKLHSFTYPYKKNDILILSSDGISNRWNFNDYEGLTFKHPAIIASVLYTDHQREKDDVTVLALKY